MSALIPLSPTKASTWLDCRHRFRLQYIDHVRVPQRWAHQSFGLSVHAVLREWFDLEPHERTHEAVAAAMRREWIDVGYRDAGQSKDAQARAVAMVWAYLHSEAADTQPHSTERSLGARTQTAAISGRIDRLDLDPSDPDERALIVVDYKTGRSEPSADDARSSMALSAYAACVQQSLRRPAYRVQLHHVPTASVVEWEHTDESLRRHLHRLDLIATEFAEAQALVEGGDAQPDEVFPPNPGPLCAWCDHRDGCTVGAQAGPAKPTWAALPVE